MNIKFFYLLSTFVGVFALVLNVNAKYENVPSDIQKTYLPYIDCVLDRKSCNFIGDQVKKLLPDWFKNECADCDSMIKSEAKKRIPNIQKYFPEDWQLIEQKYGGKSTAKQTRPTFSAPSKSTIVIGGEKSRPKFSAPSKPTDQDNQPREKLIISGNTASPEVLFANDQSFGAKAVVCLIMKKNCDEQMKFFKRSIFLFTIINTCPGCENPKVYEFFTQTKNFLKKSFPQVLQDIIVNKGE
ncbi:uncharacterized protein LOC123271501 [Cotesia glomerata]|uniref:uncharacterized protein LOC123271501 n=1 Tax=Cotesia glomerata TaxID=32391 RepID=UPI001D004C42|nr:uncharacterized protein LOC123271501 [Cotesia glomerata]